MADLVDALLLDPIDRKAKETDTDGISYSIVWKENEDGVIRASDAKGAHAFLQQSKHFTFQPEQGYVGRIMAQQRKQSTTEVISDMMTVDPRLFLRKHAALLTGIHSIVFMPQGNGNLREIGFNNPGDALKYYSTTVSSAPTLRGRSGLPLLRLDRHDEVPFSDTSSIRSPSLESPVKLVRTWGDGCIALQDIPRTRSSSPDARFTSSSGSVDQYPCDPQYACDPQYICGSGPQYICETDASNSVGSQGHPTSCGPPCKYFGRPKGCKDGFACTHCHLCRWSGQQKRNQESTANAEAWPSIESTGPPGVLSPEFCGPSLGSKGHPKSCGPPCKYYQQSKGCKDGFLCTRCHACRWVDERKSRRARMSVYTSQTAQQRYGRFVQ